MKPLMTGNPAAARVTITTSPRPALPLVTRAPAAARAAVTTTPRPRPPLVTGPHAAAPPVVTIQAIAHALHIVLTIQTDNAAPPNVRERPTPTCRPGRPTTNARKAFQ